MSKPLKIPAQFRDTVRLERVVPSWMSHAVKLLKRLHWGKLYKWRTKWMQNVLCQYNLKNCAQKKIRSILRPLWNSDRHFASSPPGGRRFWGSWRWGLYWGSAFPKTFLGKKNKATCMAYRCQHKGFEQNICSHKFFIVDGPIAVNIRQLGHLRWRQFRRSSAAIRSAKLWFCAHV